MEERVIRTMTASGMVPSTIAGKIICATASMKLPSSPQMAVSISIKPVSGFESSRKTISLTRPETGVRFHCTETNMIIIMPHQKIGME
ncbi:hypothetical protein D3C80_1492030 [compost metagenome]